MHSGDSIAYGRLDGTVMPSAVWSAFYGQSRCTVFLQPLRSGTTALWLPRMLP